MRGPSYETSPLQLSRKQTQCRPVRWVVDIQTLGSCAFEKHSFALIFLQLIACHLRFLGVGMTEGVVIGAPLMQPPGRE